MTARVRITVDGAVLHEGPRSWSSEGLAPPPPEPTEYDRLPPHGEVVDFAGFRVLWALQPIEISIADLLGGGPSLAEITRVWMDVLHRPVV